jgi:hypothetical protein
VEGVEGTAWGIVVAWVVGEGVDVDPDRYRKRKGGNFRSKGGDSICQEEIEQAPGDRDR